MSIKLSLIVIAFLTLATPAWATCRVEQDHYGGGTTSTRCDDGYTAHTEQDHYGGGSIHGQDNQGHRWTVKKSPWGGPTIIEEH